MVSLMVFNPHKILADVAVQLHKIGSANDAERMRSEVCAVLQVLLDNNPGLTGILPDLCSELETGHF